MDVSSGVTWEVRPRWSGMVKASASCLCFWDRNTLHSFFYQRDRPPRSDQGHDVWFGLLEIPRWWTVMAFLPSVSQSSRLRWKLYHGGRFHFETSFRVCAYVIPPVCGVASPPKQCVSSAPLRSLLPKTRCLMDIRVALSLEEVLTYGSWWFGSLSRGFRMISIHFECLSFHPSSTFDSFRTPWPPFSSYVLLLCSFNG